MININTQEEFDNIINRLKNAYIYYKRGYSDSNKYTIYLASGKRLKYTINPDSVPHLLGVNITTIKNCYSNRNLNAESALNLLFEESYSFYRKVQNKELQYSDIFSDYVEEKIDIFRDQLRNPYPNEIYFICEYDTKKTYLDKEVDRFKADYYIARIQNNGDIELLGFVKNNNGICTAKTSRLIKNDENKLNELKDLLKNQVVTFATSLDIENYQLEFSKKIHLSMEEKKKTIQTLVDLCSKTNCTSDITRNNLFDILCLIKTKSDVFNKKIILSSLASAMKSCELFEIDSLDEEIFNSLDEEIKELIVEYNNYICSNSNITTSNEEKYSEVLEQRNKFEKENSLLKEEIEKLKKEKEKMKVEKERLVKVEESYNDFKTKVFALVEDEKNKKQD